MQIKILILPVLLLAIEEANFLLIGNPGEQGDTVCTDEPLLDPRQSRTFSQHTLALNLPGLLFLSADNLSTGLQLTSALGD